jgi:multicomponent K+:H+ antiporter subunit A
MSVVALAGGIFLYSQRAFLFAAREHTSKARAEQIYAYLMEELLGFARLITGLLDNNSLQRYVVVLVGVVIGLGFMGYGLGGPTPLTGPVPVQAPTWMDAAGLLALMVSALAAAYMHRSRLIALVLVGVVGLMVALAFVRFSAPDLALTQLSVEVVTTVLLLLALYFLPQQTRKETTLARRLRDGFVACVAGVGAGLVSWSLFTRPHQTLSDFYLRNSVPEGGGDNVVNVILVDFRGFDTLGEITVLAIAAIGIHAMLEGLRLKLPHIGLDGRPWARQPHPLFLSVLSRALLPMALVVAFYILLRGHNLPGGGFIAGLVTAVALILQYLGNGIAWTQQRFVFRYYLTFAIGLFVAAAAGMGSWFFDYPFLTSTHGYVYLPLLGKVHLASAMVFDIGVYITVVGAVLLIIAELGRLSIAQERDPSQSTSKGTL